MFTVAKDPFFIINAIAPHPVTHLKLGIVTFLSAQYANLIPVVSLGNNSQSCGLFGTKIIKYSAIR